MKTINLFLLVIILISGCINDKKSDFTNQEIIDKGKHVIAITEDTLKKELFGVVHGKGPVEAIEYCNLNAELITSIYEKENVVEISRTASKYRNPENAPDSLELLVLKEYTKLVSKGVELEPEIYKTDKKIHYFQPIILNKACLVCHGNPDKEIAPTVFEQINKKYPTDKATGFKEGDLRGMWHIVFSN